MGDAHEHKHGTMDTSVQERTFAGFLTAMKWGIAGCLAIVVFLAIFNV